MAVQVVFRLPDAETRELLKRALSVKGESIQSWAERRAMAEAEVQRQREAFGTMPNEAAGEGLARES